MPSRKFLIAAGVLVVAAGATAVTAHSFRGQHDGWRGEHEDRGWRSRGWGGWRDSVKKSEFDERTRTSFARIDTNNDKVIDADEAKKLITERMSDRGHRWRERKQQRRLARLLKRFDLNSDKKIERAEFDKQIEFFFKRMDLDGDGKITDADLPPMMRGRDVLKGTGKPRGFKRMRGPGRFLARLHGADTDGNGEISRAEADAAAAKRFNVFDRTKDGVIEQADFAALKQEIVDYRVKRFFHRHEAGADNKLTMDQYTAVRDRRFARWDRNGDSVLSSEEMPHRMKRRMHHRGWRDHWRRHGQHDDRRWNNDRRDQPGDYERRDDGRPGHSL